MRWLFSKITFIFGYSKNILNWFWNLILIEIPLWIEICCQILKWRCLKFNQLLRLWWLWSGSNHMLWNNLICFRYDLGWFKWHHLEWLFQIIFNLLNTDTYLTHRMLNHLFLKYLNFIIILVIFFFFWRIFEQGDVLFDIKLELIIWFFLIWLLLILRSGWLVWLLISWCKSSLNQFIFIIKLPKSFLINILIFINLVLFIFFIFTCSDFFIK